jgi:hypothetical protein
MIALLDKTVEKEARSDAQTPDRNAHVGSADHIFIGYPMRPGVFMEKTEGGKGKIKLTRATYRNGTVASQESSDYCRNFNWLWKIAFNDKRHKYSHWCLVHDDIRFPVGAIDVLIDEMNRVGADVISAVIAIKNDTDNTSTGLRDPFSHDNRLFTRTECHEQLPETFCAKDAREAGFRIGRDDTLLVNTGLLVVRWDLPCIAEFPGFETRHFLQIRNGEMEAGELTEDWNFSEWAQRRGLKVFASRKVPVVHIGDWARNRDTGEKILDETGQPFRIEYPSWPEKMAEEIAA